MPIRNVLIVGAGFMGSQIGLQCVLHGCRVTMYDVDDKALSQSALSQRQLLKDMITAEAVDPGDAQKRLDSINRTSTLAEATPDSHLVIEAIREQLEIKREVFNQLDRHCPPETILATNSSSIRISKIESATRRPDKVLNTHFVHPVWRHPFVELMRGSKTSDHTLQEVRQFMESIQILPFLVRREYTGFIFNRIWRAVKREALHMVDRGVASVEDVDRTWMIQMETPIGPFALMDQIGLDVIKDIEMVYYGESGSEADAPPAMLLEKIDKGELGVKTGKGFYEYPNPSWKSADFLKHSSS